MNLKSYNMVKYEKLCEEELDVLLFLYSKGGVFSRITNIAISKMNLFMSKLLIKRQ